MERIAIYMNEINSIFSYLDKLLISWPEQDNINLINNLMEYKEDAIIYKNIIEDIENNIDNRGD